MARDSARPMAYQISPDDPLDSTFRVGSHETVTTPIPSHVPTFDTPVLYTMSNENLVNPVGALIQQSQEEIALRLGVVRYRVDKNTPAEQIADEFKSKYRRCEVCKKRRKKCLYSSPERCQYCSNKNLVCRPVNVSPVQDIGFEPHNQTLQTITFPSLSSIIIDPSELSEKELWYFNDMYKSTCSAPSQDNFDIHPHIWRAYNKIEKTLLYSLLAYYVRRLSISRSTSDYNEDYYSFKTRFQESQWIAIIKGEATEGHLFAAFLAILSCRNESPPNWDEMKIHQREFLSILSGLITKKARRNFNPSMRLQYLYPYLLSYVRRMTVFMENEESDFSSDYYMLQLSNRLISCPIDLAQNQGPPTGLSIVSRKEDGRPCWNGLLFRVYDDIRGLHGCVQVAVSCYPATSEVDYSMLSILIDAIGGIRERNRSIRDLPSVTEVLRMILNVRPGSPLFCLCYDRDEDYLPWFIHHHYTLSALVFVMDYILKKDTENPAMQLVDDFLHTANVLLPMNELCWGWNTVSTSFVAIGLLIGKHFSRHYNEVSLKREALLDVWRRQHIPGRFARDSNCIEQTRVKKFWQSRMETKDYLEFLSESSKLWAPLFARCCPESLVGMDIRYWGRKTCPVHRELSPLAVNES